MTAQHRLTTQGRAMDPDGDVFSDAANAEMAVTYRTGGSEFALTAAADAYLQMVHGLGYNRADARAAVNGVRADIP